MNVTHIDTCLGCYLTDHHNRPGECLIGVPVNGTSTYHEVMEDLIQQVHMQSFDSEEFDYDAAEALDELEAATVKAALIFFNDSMQAFDDGRAPRFLPFQCVDENIGCLTAEEINSFVYRLDNSR